jgi:hypothetical protein
MWIEVKDERENLDESFSTRLPAYAVPPASATYAQQHTFTSQYIQQRRHWSAAHEYAAEEEEGGLRGKRCAAMEKAD